MSANSEYDLSQPYEGKSVPTHASGDTSGADELIRLRAQVRDYARYLDAVAEALHPHKPKGGWTYLPDQLAGMVERLRAEVSELNQLFEAQHKCTTEADRLWREATGRHNVMPDLGTLVQWLLDRATKAEAEVESLRKQTAGYAKAGLVAR